MARMGLSESLVENLNDNTMRFSFEQAVESYGISIDPKYNSLVTAGSNLEVWATDMDEKNVLVFDEEYGWEMLSKESWIKQIWDRGLHNYSDDSKLTLIRTIPALKDYTPEIKCVSNELTICYYIWRDGVNEYSALARTPLEARYLISKELEHYPKILNTNPEVYYRPRAFISLGDS